MDYHTFTLIRRIVHHTLLAVGSVFLLSALLLLSGQTFIEIDTVTLAYRFLIMPTFFLFLLDVGLTIYMQTIDHGSAAKETPHGKFRTIFLILIGIAVFFTLLFYVL